MSEYMITPLRIEGNCGQRMTGKREEGYTELMCVVNVSITYVHKSEL